MKKVIALLLCAVLAVSMTGCTASGGVGGLIKDFASDISGLVPNDVEHLFKSKNGNDSTHAHDNILSTGYANMLKSDKYYISYSSTPGGEVTEYGRSGVRAGTKTSGTHIVLDDGKYYLLDDVNLTATVIDPANYPSAPLAVDASDITFSEAGEDTMDGKTMTYEDYTAGGGTIRFWLDGSDLYAMDIKQTACTVMIYVTDFSKHVSSELVNVPANYAVVG